MIPNKIFFSESRLMNLRVLMVAGHPVDVNVKSGKLEHLYLSQEKVFYIFNF